MDIHQIRYVITDHNESKFYKMGAYYVEDILQALYLNKEMAEYHLNRCLNDFQKKIFTKVIEVYVVVSKSYNQE